MYENERRKLVEALKKRGIKDESVLQSFMDVERHKFVPDVMNSHAYKDVALPIGHGQTISQPFTVAFMTEALHLQPGSKVLEIGTGSGYQAAILYNMGMKVFSIERNHNIYERTQKLFDELGIRVAMRCSDGTLGWEEFSPYQGILVTAGSPSIPENLKKQLAVKGRMVIPVGDRTSQTMEILTKESDTDFSIKKIPRFAFVPLIGKEGWKEK